MCILTSSGGSSVGTDSVNDDNSLLAGDVYVTLFRMHVEEETFTGHS